MYRQIHQIRRIELGMKIGRLDHLHFPSLSKVPITKKKNANSSEHSSDAKKNLPSQIV